MNRESNPALRLLARVRPTAWLLPCAVVLGALAGLVYSGMQTPRYSATSYVVVVPAEESDPGAALGFAQAYGRVAVDVAVRGGAAAKAGVATRTLRAGVQAATSPEAPMISLTARSTKPDTAVRMADSVAQALVDTSGETRKRTGVDVLSFSRASKPSAPTSPSAPVAALVGGCAAGLLCGLALLVRPRRSDAGKGEDIVVPVRTRVAALQKEPV